MREEVGCVNEVNCIDMVAGGDGFYEEGWSQPVRETVTYVTPRPLPPPVGIEFLRTLQYVFIRPLLHNNVTDTRHHTNSI
eukprot:scaffold8843_cov82-Skeletonema_dohrnii-CCMP3373.AAC.2